MRGRAARGCAALAVACTLARVAMGAEEPAPLGFAFRNVAAPAGLEAVTVYGGRQSNKYLLETTGCGAAFLDYDNDGWLDVFLVNGRTLEESPTGATPTSHLYRNKGDGTFEDTTDEAHLNASGWGQGVCAGDFDNDGHVDLFASYWGRNRLYRNGGDGTFEDVTVRLGPAPAQARWGTGCAFLDFDRDGLLDLFVANYIDLDLAQTPTPDSGLCRYKGVPVACGPPGLRGGTNVLYRNRGTRGFEDVSVAAGITKASGTYGLGVSTLDFDDDGWTDLYVANDSNPSALYRNKHDGTFEDIGVPSGCAYSQDGKPQAGMGVGIGDYDRNGRMDILKTNFAGDTSTLYAGTPDGFCEDRTFASGLGLVTRWLGWGAGFVDLDRDTWLDAFLVNGHVYPEVAQLETEAGYEQRKVVYRGGPGGKLVEITEQVGPPATTPRAGRGAAFGDYDNDGDVDVLVNNMHETPDLFRTESRNAHHWLLVRLVGTKSNRSAIGARVRCTTGGVTQTQEVRGGGSYLSQNDLRVHFGLAAADKVDRLEVRWPSGLEETWRDVRADQIVTLTEGATSEDSAAVLAEARRGIALYHSDEHVLAIEALTPIVERLPEGSVERREAVQVLGLSYYLAGRLPESLPFLERTAEWAADNRELAYILANTYIQTRQADKARAAAARLFEVSVDSAAAHLLTAQLMVRLELEDPADAELKAALAKDPRLPQAHYLLGQAAIFRSRLDEAIGLLRRELEIHPGHAMALYRLGDAYTRQQKWGDAVAALQKSIWLNPHFSGPYILLGQCYVKLGQPSTAEGMLRRAIEYDPNNKAAHYLLAQLLQRGGRAEAARAEFEIAERLQAGPERR